ncbi:MAG: amino acid permease [Acidimicrobiaceae bacterium]|nr:amino acid permease [Acidimicrobiaceae bacterium]
MSHSEARDVQGNGRLAGTEPVLPGWTPPVASGPGAPLPESRAYRLKRFLLGPPLISDQLAEERLGKPTALAVLSSDVMSSSAYGTEQMLRILIPVGGLAAFALVTPITLVLLCVLAVVTVCYREVVKSYPKAGGSYVVSRDNFGPNVAQVAGAALLISYTITVAVSIAAGTDAIISAFPSLGSAVVPLSIAFVVLIAYGNLRGLTEAGKLFAIPTYFFIANMAVLILAGLAKAAAGDLGHVPAAHGQIAFGQKGGGLLLGVSLFYAARAFANGGSAMTGTEAISNGVSIFRDPQPRNARTTLVVMSTILGSMFLGVSVLSALGHSRPFESGTPTVVSEIGRLVYGHSAAGSLLYGFLQASTAIILILAANTSFTGFPFLVSFVAEDSFLPRTLTVRGHRLVFSNGIIVLAVASIALLVATGAKVASLIPMYAIGVFTGFTMAGAGMTKHHLTHKQPGWKRSVVINGIAAVVCLLVVLIFAITEFTRGAWVVVVVMPLLIYGLTRTNAQYRTEDAVLAEGAAAAAYEAPVLRRHTAIVLVDRIDMATARAIQYARNLNPDELYAVHLNLDNRRADAIMRRWTELGLSRLPLEVIEVPDRRLARAALELASRAAADGQTEVSVLIPTRAYRGSWSVLLHGKNADRLVKALGQIPHVNATIVPFNVADIAAAKKILGRARDLNAAPRREPSPSSGPKFIRVPDATPIAELHHRQQATVAGRIHSLRVKPSFDTPALEATITDSSGAELLVVFMGRKAIPGIHTGTQILLRGAVGDRRGRLAMLNPTYELLSVPDTEQEEL